MVVIIIFIGMGWDPVLHQHPLLLLLCGVSATSELLLLLVLLSVPSPSLPLFLSGEGFRRRNHAVDVSGRLSASCDTLLPRDLVEQGNNVIIIRVGRSVVGRSVGPFVLEILFRFAFPPSIYFTM